MASLSPLLHNFSSDDITQLSNFGESRSYTAGEVIMNEGEPNKYLYLLLSGKVEVSKKGVGSSRVDLQACKLEYSIVSPK